MATLTRRDVLITALSAAGLPAWPDAAPALTLEGRLAGGQSLHLTREALQQLPQHRFTTRSPWSRGSHTYAGPLLRDVLAAARAQGSHVKAVALNDYQVTIPVRDARDWNVIVALQIDGQPITVRDKGPFFVIYPFDSDVRLQSAAYFARSIWQLKSLTVE